MKAKNKGFTLVEVIIALIIVMIAATAFIKVYDAGNRVFIKNRAKAEAAVIAQNYFEKLRAHPEEIAVGEKDEIQESFDGVRNYVLTIKIDIDNNEPDEYLSGKLYCVILEVKGKNINTERFATKIFVEN